MATKDFVYLGLIAFSAIVFYLHGYYAGATLGHGRFTRGKREARNRTPAPTIPAEATPEPCVARIGLGNLTGSRVQTHHSEKLELVDSVRCFFGNN